MLRVGLTGGIACGKSHVLRRLAARGLQTLDLDAVARQVSAPGGPAFAEIVSAFGPGVVGPEGALDRPALAARVFADESSRARLNAIVHPRIRATESAWVTSLAAETSAVLVTDAALLVEAGVHLRFDRLLVVHCDPALQLARLRARDGLDETAARARIAAQMPLAEKRAFAHLELDSSGSLAETNRLADALAEELLAAARRPRRPGVPLETLLGGLVHAPEEGPRGLTAVLLLAEAAEAAGLEMERLAARLTPPARGPWYRAAEESAPGARATALSVAAAAWALMRGAPDPPFLAAAMGTLARLTHRVPADRADACWLALVAQELAAAHEAEDVERCAARLAPLAARFGGAPVSDALRSVWAAVRRWPRRPDEAGRACAAAGGEAALAAALAGFGSTPAPVGLPQAATLRAALVRLEAAASAPRD